MNNTPIQHQNTTPKTETDVINNKYYFLLHIYGTNPLDNFLIKL